MPNKLDINVVITRHFIILELVSD